MATRLTIEWNHDGFEEILCSDGVMALVEEQTERIKDAANSYYAGDGFDSGTRLGWAYGSQRAMGFVYSTDKESAIAESEHKALSRAVSR